MKILGLDISSNSTGWAVLDDDTVLGYGVIKTDGDGVVRLISFYTQLVNILEDYNDIEWAGIEDTYIQNAVTTKLLSNYHGVAMLVLGLKYGMKEILHKRQIDNLVARKNNPRARPKIPEKAIYYPTATEIFSVLGMYCPNDREKKKQDSISWVKDNLYIELDRDEDDMADALCIGMATGITVRKLN